ncbi:MAG TPA: HoxN/HupN/NixA family nickel/cobalt transporter [Burkholderiales bacterium]|nr:HoxN/HupN/NixA family nickel/cobalt transporter [Burkholderiales bacterium]
MTTRSAAAAGAGAAQAPGRPIGFGADEWRRLAGLYGCVALLHVAGWGLFLYYAAREPLLAGLGFAAYMFGLRHAFDADHIAAVDDTVRLLMQKGRPTLGVGFFFSLGHSSIVVLLALAAVAATAALKLHLPELRALGAVIGASVSGVFLWVVAILNLAVLLDLLKVWRKARREAHRHAHVAQLLGQRGLLNRLFGGRLAKAIDHGWQMYPVGLLFGLGFDTASEIALLAMTAGASAGNLPTAAVLSLPLLFAAGMTVMDTTDGVLMTKVYNWSFLNPLRKVFYNIATTALSIAVALVIGTIELLQVLRAALGLRGPLFDFVGALDFGVVGYVVVGIFLMAWGTSLALWKFGRIEDSDRPAPRLVGREHVHGDGLRHTHKHL